MLNKINRSKTKHAVFFATLMLVAAYLLAGTPYVEMAVMMLIALYFATQVKSEDCNKPEHDSK